MSCEDYNRQGLGCPWPAPQIIVDLALKQDKHGQFKTKGYVVFDMLGDCYVLTTTRKAE